MPWGLAIGAVVSGISGMAASKANEDAQKQTTEEEIKAQKALLEEKRQFDLQDRAYHQGAVGNWSKYAAGAPPPGTAAPDKDAAANSGAPTDPNALPGAAPGGAQPMNGPAIPWQLRPQMGSNNGRAPASLWQQFIPPNGN